MNWYNRIILAGLPILKLRDFSKKLKNLGFYLDRSRGHEIWKHPDGRTIPLPRHLGKDINPALAYNIIKNQVGMDVQDFMSVA